MKFETVLAASLATKLLRAGQPISEASAPQYCALSIDLGDPALVDQWLAAEDTRLLVGNRRLASLGLQNLITPDNQASASLINLPPGVDQSTVMTLAQGHPGAVGPLDPAIMAGHIDIGASLFGYLKLAKALPAALVRPRDALPAAQVPATTAPELDLKSYHHALAASLVQVGDTPVPLEQIGDTRMHLFRDCLGDERHMAVEIGHHGPSDDDTPVLVRVHSSCVTGDIFHSQRCDCGHQLNAALSTMANAGRGILIYLAQEGRGIGLNNKLKSYLLQQSGLDTVDGNFALGFEDDERYFTYARRILHLMGITKVRLLTNNPSKVLSLQDDELKVVERLPLVELHSDLAAQYVATKAAKSGHILD